MRNAGRTEGEAARNGKMRQFDIREFERQPGKVTADTVESRLDGVLCGINGCGDCSFYAVPD